MAYRLDLSKPAAEAVRETLLERIDDAIARLRYEQPEDPAKNVHETRKDLKKARAVLRLARPCVKRGERRRANALLRDVGRELSAARDAAALRGTARELAEVGGGRVPAELFEEMIAGLDARVEKASDAPYDAPELVGMLESVARRLAKGVGGECSWRDLIRATTEFYARGREAFAEARELRTDEALHTWRKRAKDLWYHQRLLRDLWDPVLPAYAEATHQLTDLLGDDHDLAVLAVELDGKLGKKLSDPDALKEVVAWRRGVLQEEAFALGALVYAERPKAYERRLRDYARTA